MGRRIIDFYQEFGVNTIFTNDIAIAMGHIKPFLRIVDEPLTAGAQLYFNHMVRWTP